MFFVLLDLAAVVALFKTLSSELRVSRFSGRHTTFCWNCNATFRLHFLHGFACVEGLDMLWIDSSEVIVVARPVIK